MKKITLILLGTVTIMVGCKSKKAAASPKEAVTDAQVAAVKTRFPDASRPELEKGYAVFTGACTKCHGTKDVTGYTEPRLLEIVDVMAKKAEITAEEKQALIRFAVGVRATK